ncbi:hypothetical protein Csa_006118 [Cucumis sativus]|uniref:Uncharacterized protein n=1 Tax=Cucumis sativus TaxID=3659 RepID=A0A0A0LP77_CUCSA|nr:hypothetical protein Csa_006118 [Cucumis sativus]
MSNESGEGVEPFRKGEKYGSELLICVLAQRDGKGAEAYGRLLVSAAIAGLLSYASAGEELVVRSRGRWSVTGDEN